MKPYSPNVGDTLLGMILFSRKNFGSLGFVETFQHFCENMQGLFSAVALELWHAGFCRYISGTIAILAVKHIPSCCHTVSLSLHSYCYPLGSVFKIFHQASCSGLLMCFPSVVPHRANTHPKHKNNRTKLS